MTILLLVIGVLLKYMLVSFAHVCQPFTVSFNSTGPNWSRAQRMDQQKDLQASDRIQFPQAAISQQEQPNQKVHEVMSLSC